MDQRTLGRSLRSKTLGARFVLSSNVTVGKRYCSTVLVHSMAEAPAAPVPGSPHAPDVYLLSRSPLVYCSGS